MEISKIKKILLSNFYPIGLFSFFVIYYLIWIKYNFHSVTFNTNDLKTAVSIFNYKPYISIFLNNIFSSETFNLFFGYCFFPSLISVLLFLIFRKILANNVWSLSLTFLSISASENYPFHKFLLSFVSNMNTRETINIYENFEIMGFPIPAFSIFFFCLVFYLTLKSIKFSRIKIYFITSLWIVMFHIHPVDGFIGNLYWIGLIGILFLQKKVDLNKSDFLILFVIYLLNTFILISQLSFETLIVKNSQTISYYSIIFYFLFPLILIFLCLFLLKIDFYEFSQKFLNIYLMMIVEIILIVLSINGIGFELQMLENRITMFLLHFLYYVPIIYYLSKDEIFYINSINKSSISGKVVIVFYYIFNKYKNFYLLAFTFLIIVFFALSIKI